MEIKNIFNILIKYYENLITIEFSIEKTNIA
jgi:hypothetical protein